MRFYSSGTERYPSHSEREDQSGSATYAASEEENLGVLSDSESNALCDGDSDAANHVSDHSTASLLDNNASELNAHSSDDDILVSRLDELVLSEPKEHIEIPSGKRLPLCEKSSPENVSKAIEILIEEANAENARKQRLSPYKLAQEGLVQYNLEIKDITDGATREIKIVTLKYSSVVTDGKQQLSKGERVTISLQYEDPTDKSKRKARIERQDSVRGVVSSLSPEAIEVAIDSTYVDSLPEGTLQVEGIQVLEVYHRMLSAISMYRSAEQGFSELPLLGNIVRGQGRASVARWRGVASESLNKSQLRAVEYAIGSNLGLIKGPPGTGKTIVLCEIILNLLRKGENILICCASHAAVDNLIARLDKVKHGYEIARLGHPHLIHESVRRHSDFVKGKSKKKNYDRMGARIIAGTLHAVCDLENFSSVDTIVIDEVCQALQPQCWIPLVHHETATRLVIAGDDKQLSPTITSLNPNVNEVLCITLYDVLAELYGEKVIHLLDTQYRMSKDIMQFSSDYMYDGHLKAAPSVANQKLHHVSHVNGGTLASHSVIWIDTSNLGHTEKTQKKGRLANPTEAKLVKDFYALLRKHGVKTEDVGIISPYAPQKNLLKSRLPSIEVNTIDSFQGQEKNVIILSLVRSNKSAAIGFLSDERRLNVAMTRAKYQLCVVADMNTMRLCKSPMLKQWVKWCEDNALIIHPRENGRL